MNYIKIGNTKIELTEEQINEIKEQFGIEKVVLSSIEPGDTFKIGNHEFFVLEQSGDTTAVILKDLLHTEVQFGNNNNYDGSDVDKLCKEFENEISEFCGKDNLIEHTVDLTTDDGLKDYGKVRRKMSLLTAEMYRKYVYLLDKHKPDCWWWLATAHSTTTHDNPNWVKCVSPSGDIDSGFYDDDYGVRPFCILKSNIFVSK